MIKTWLSLTLVLGFSIAHADVETPEFENRSDCKAALQLEIETESNADLLLTEAKEKLAAEKARLEADAKNHSARDNDQMRMQIETRFEAIAKGLEKELLERRQITDGVCR